MPEPTLEMLQALPRGDLTWIERPDGTRLRCLVSEGDRPSGASSRTIVLAHGILCSIPSYNLVGPELARRGYRVITFDQRAHGRSTCGRDGTTTEAMAADYRAILEHFDVRNGILVGHSMGAYLATRFCIDHPEVVRQRLDGMVLVSGHGGDAARGNFQTKIQVRLLELGISRQLVRHPWLGQRLGRTLFGRTEPHPAYLEVGRRLLLEMDLTPISRILRDMIELQHYDRVASIELPTEVICGDRDRASPPWCSEALAKIKGARTTRLPNVGHMTIYEAPEAIIDAVIRLASKAPSRAIAS